MSHDDSRVVGGDSSVMTFDVAGQAYATPVEYVSSVIRLPVITRVPHVSPVILGVMNLRSSIVPVVSARRLFGLGEAEGPSGQFRVIVVDGGSTLQGLLVDRVRDVLEVPSSGLSHDVPIPPGIDAEVFKGFFRRDDETYLLVDLVRLVSAALSC